MIKTAQQLLQIIPEIDCWRIQDNDTLVGVVNGEYSDEDSQEHEVPLTILAVLHPDLPIALRAQIEWTAKNWSAAHPVTNGSAAKDLLALLQNGSYNLTDSRGVNHTLVDISNFQVHSNGCLVSVHGTQCSIQTTVAEGRSIQFITKSSHYCTIQAQAEELDSHFPGWRARWDLGQQLGLPFGELLPYVLVAPVQQASLSNMVFE